MESAKMSDDATPVTVDRYGDFTQIDAEAREEAEAAGALRKFKSFVDGEPFDADHDFLAFARAQYLGLLESYSKMERELHRANAVLTERQRGAVISLRDPYTLSEAYERGYFGGLYRGLAFGSDLLESALREGKA